jgi:hypothetical protein
VAPHRVHGLAHVHLSHYRRFMIHQVVARLEFCTCRRMNVWEAGATGYLALDQLEAGVWPSAWPLLQGAMSAARSAAPTRSDVSAQSPQSIRGGLRFRPLRCERSITDVSTFGTA